MIERSWNDVRAAMRVLRRNPTVTVVAAITLALGVGANTAIFTIINAVLLRPLPYAQPDRIVTVWETDRVDGGRGVVGSLNFRDLRDAATTLDAFAVYGYESFILAEQGDAQRLLGAAVSADFFSVFAMEPFLGRSLSASSDAPGAPREAVLANGFWQRRFGGAPGIVGRTLVLSGVPHEVTGVMPAAFAFPHANVDVWTSYPIDYARESRGSNYLFAVAKLGQGITIERAHTDLNAIARTLGDAFPETNANTAVLLVGLQEEIVGSARTMLLVVLGAVGLVLLIACANVSNLVLVRATGRSTEIAVRRALGADTPTLARQFLAESLLLSLLAGAAGVALAFWGVAALVRSSPDLIPRSREIAPDIRVLGVALLVILSIALILACVQIVAFGRRPSFLVREGAGNSAGRGKQRTRSALATAQIALVLPLLSGAGLLIQTLRALQAVPTGFAPEHVLTMNASLSETRYGEPERQRLFVTAVLERVTAIPGVEAAGITSDLPFSGSRATTSFEIEGAPDNAGGTPVADHRQISPDYFRAMGIALLRGRTFTSEDGEGAVPVAIVNQTLASRYFPGIDPIGRRIIYSRSRTRVQIIGVVSDVVHDDLRAEPIAEIYVPFAQFPLTRIFLAVRAVTGPVLLPAIRAAVADVDPEQPVYSVRMMEERVAQSIAPQRATSLLITTFSLLALVLASIGLYGVIAYGVAHRSRELAIRTALGARPADLARLVLQHGFLLVLPGLLIGLGAALVFMRVLASLLFGVEPGDAMTLALACMSIILIALAACWSPARRATRTDPMYAMRA